MGGSEQATNSDMSGGRYGLYVSIARAGTVSYTHCTREGMKRPNVFPASEVGPDVTRSVVGSHTRLHAEAVQRSTMRHRWLGRPVYSMYVQQTHACICNSSVYFRWKPYVLTPFFLLASSRRRHIRFSTAMRAHLQNTPRVIHEMRFVRITSP